jgi:uncharacterized membrane protein
MASDGQQQIDAYLSRLRTGLRGLHSDEVRDIVEELRSHVIEKSSEAGEISASRVEATLTALGPAEVLASEYVTDAVLARAEVSRSPMRILESLFRWASLSIAGFFVLIGSIVGYSLGVIFFLLALFKPFHPHTAGLWVWEDPAQGLVYSARMGFGVPPAGANEILGWSIIPLGLVLGCGLVMLTTRFALWCAKQYRNTRVARQA